LREFFGNTTSKILLFCIVAHFQYISGATIYDNTYVIEKLMKAIFLCISLALMTSAHAQTNIYHSFPVSPIWRVDYNYSYGFGNGCFVTYYYHYYSTGDTTISSYTYKKIHRSFVLDTDTTKCSPVLIDSGYVGALRDDS